MKKDVERNTLDRVAKNSLYTSMSNTMMIEYCSMIFDRFLVEGSILEMGPAEGVMTQYLALKTSDLVLLEGSKVFAKQLAEKYPTALISTELFEEYSPRKKFDNIVLGHVLEHVENPVLILEQCKEWLAENGRILAAVPNSRSLHRQAAVVMGLLHSEDAMSELDHHHGHRRIYNPETFRQDFLKAKLRINHFGGYWLKPLSNSQIHTHWSPQLLHSFMVLGERYPDIAAEIYVIATR